MTTPAEAMAALFDAAPGNDLPNLPNYNICPTNQVCAVTSEQGHRRIVSLRWGFIPYWYKTPGDGPLLINARGETVAEKPAFRAAVRHQRCLIPATGFYEWTKDADGNRLPWYIHPDDGGTLAFAGIYQHWKGQEKGAEVEHVTCAIVTTEASPKMQAIHHREPVTLAPQDWPLWLGEAGKGAAKLMTHAPEDRLAFHRVGTAVNSNRAAGPELITPIEV
ncbi:putative SOS response-associated peptidase YedK [Litoreibacter ponti]|uniref:Abasic site processing protein n=2 Tax=Litoreibacter ponti TaxID=1510457 RepID=A0A2T6BDV3_9RHOB|nr:putative SOS response-associated peptidase YedK [Litoreibacter ponti]